MRNIVEALTYDVYDYTCLGLFESHKLMFSFQVRLCHMACLQQLYATLITEVCFVIDFAACVPAHQADASI